MIYKRIAKPQIGYFIKRILSKISLPIRKLVELDFGLAVYGFDNNLKPSWLGIRGEFDDSVAFGRAIEDCSCYAWDLRSILIHEKDLDEATVFHEYGHALDWALGFRAGQNRPISSSLEEIIRAFKKGCALDWYAAINPQEYFATAFAAYINDLGDRLGTFAAHTRAELKEKDPMMLKFFEKFEEVKE